MVIEAVLNPDHMPINQYELQIAGEGPYVFTTVSGLEEELDVVVLPDRSERTTGNSKVIEFTTTSPLHHTVEISALETWFDQCHNAEGAYQKDATMIYRSSSGAVTKNIQLNSVFLKKRKYPEADMDNDGDMAIVEWTFSARITNFNKPAV